MLAVGAHLALAALLRDEEMHLIPLLVALFGIGRLAFWLGYEGGAGRRAFGFATTFYPTAGAYLLSLALLLVRCASAEALQRPVQPDPDPANWRPRKATGGIAMTGSPTPPELVRIEDFEFVPRFGRLDVAQLAGVSGAGG